MLNGQTFDKGKEVMEAIMSLSTRGMQFHKSVSPATQQVIKRCLELNPVKRVGLS